jgi:hypothetical protein
MMHHAWLRKRRIMCGYYISSTLVDGIACPHARSVRVNIRDLFFFELMD